MEGKKDEDDEEMKLRMILFIIFFLLHHHLSSSNIIIIFFAKVKDRSLGRKFSLIIWKSKTKSYCCFFFSSVSLWSSPIKWSRKWRVAVACSKQIRKNQSEATLLRTHQRRGNKNVKIILNRLILQTLSTQRKGRTTNVQG